MDLLTGLTAISQTLAITKELRSIDDKIVVAEFKLKIADIVDKLLDAKQSLVDAQETEASLRKEITELRENAARRAALRDSDGCLYEVDASGTNVGEPYCNVCYVKEDKLIRLRHHPARVRIHSHYKCDICHTSIITGPSLPYQTPQGNRGTWTR